MKIASLLCHLYKFGTEKPKKSYLNWYEEITKGVEQNPIHLEQKKTKKLSRNQYEEPP